MNALRLLAGGLVALLPASAGAQAYQCVIPRVVAPLRLPTPDGPVRRLPVESYVLAASWSPDYCKTSGDTRSMQCSGESGRFGFILHGLWPESRRAAPQWCGAATLPPADQLRRHLCMTPSAQLLVHEWAKHGTCMTGRPETYFKVAGILWNAVRWPDADRLSRKRDLTAGDLRDEFLARNKGWRRESVGIELSHTGWLREIRLCYGKDFRPARCPAQRFGPRDEAAIRIWRGL